MSAADKPSLRLVFAEIGFTLIVAVVALLWNPFNLWTQFDDGGRALFMNIVSVEYPGRRPPAAAVLVGDDFARTWQLPWPLPLEAHEEILTTIAEQAPAAIFVDFVFIDRRESDEAIQGFAETIDRIGARTPIFLAVAPTAQPDDEAILRELAAVAAANANVDLVSVALDERSKRHLLYPLSGTANGQRLDSAALAMARLAAPRRVARLEQAGRLGPIDLVWPAPPPASNCARGDAALQAECRAVSQSAPMRAGRLLLSGLVPIRSEYLRLPEPYKLHTYPVETLRATQLLEGGGGALSGAYVFYGGDFNFAANDAMSSPLYGVGRSNTLPGVMAHAVAFDNVVTLGRGVFAADSAFGLPDNILRAVLAVIVCLVAGVFWLLGVIFIPDRARAAPKTYKMLLSYRTWFVPAFILVALVAFLWLRLSPGVWLSVLAVATLRFTLPWLGKVQVSHNRTRAS